MLRCALALHLPMVGSTSALLSCIDFGMPDWVAIQAVAGATYDVAIDGSNGATGTFDLQVTCE